MRKKIELNEDQLDIAQGIESTVKFFVGLMVVIMVALLLGISLYIFGVLPYMTFQNALESLNGTPLDRFGWKGNITDYLCLSSLSIFIISGVAKIFWAVFGNARKAGGAVSGGINAAAENVKNKAARR